MAETEATPTNGAAGAGDAPDAESTPDGELLRWYLERGSEAAFARLVQRHLGLVYATCRRETGDPDLAGDVAQVVFLILAKKAPALKERQSLAGWLFQTARLAAANARRQEALRLRREQEVSEALGRQQPGAEGTWGGIEPGLNIALARLGALDREAVLLRFLEGHSLADVGARLGLSENTARMRVSRALEKLRRYLSPAGTSLAAALATLLAERSAAAVPAALAAAVRATAPASLAPPPGAEGLRIYRLTQGTLKIMSLRTASAACAALLVAATLPLIAASRLPRAGHSQRQAARLRVSPVQHRSPAAEAGPPPSPQPLLARQLSDLHLRGDFTLVYRVTARDRRTPAMLARDGETSPHPVEQFSVTLSGHDGRLLYLSDRGARNRRENTRSAFLLDADREYEAGAADAGMINADGTARGAAYRDGNVDRLAYCPLPGVGLPGVDLIQAPVLAATAPGGRARFSGRVPRLNIIGEDPYRAGWIETVHSQGRLRVLSLVVGPHSLPRQAWHFTASRLFEGRWIGSRMEADTYYGAVPSDRGTAAAPSFTASYQLVEARGVSLGADAFDIGSHLSKGAWVADTADDVTFAFDPGAGTLKQQAARALAKRRGTRP